MERVLCLVMGYVFGLFQTGYLYSRSKHMDIRNYGSGNSGSTNVLRVMGKKAGLIVFLGDAGKMIAACLITRVLFRSQPELYSVPDIRRIFICCACIPAQEPSSDTTFRFIWDLRVARALRPPQGFWPPQTGV